MQPQPEEHVLPLPNPLAHGLQGWTPPTSKEMVTEGFFSEFRTADEYEMVFRMWKKVSAMKTELLRAVEDEIFSTAPLDAVHLAQYMVLHEFWAFGLRWQSVHGI